MKSSCGFVESGMRFHGPEKIRRLCTPFTDLRDAGSVRFLLAAGNNIV